MKPRKLLYSSIITTMLVGLASGMFMSTVGAEESSPVQEYEFYPTPHSVAYDEGEMSLEDEINVIYDDTIDDVTKKKLASVFEDNNLPKPVSAEEPSDDEINIFVGTEGSGGPAEQHAEEAFGGNSVDFNEIDAYQLEIDSDNITVIGKDTDAAFYGLASLGKILDQSQDGVVQNLEIKDYANTEVRGFIEGFYGIPWSNEDRKSLMEFGGQFKTTSYIFAPKDDPYHREKWEDLYPEEELEEIRDMVEVGQENKTEFVWTISPLGEAAKVAQEEGDEAAMDMLDENTENLLDKFDQLYDAGVRQFGILGDDVGALPLDYVVEQMDAVSAWADEKGDVKDTIYTPAAYNSAWAWDGGEELNKLEKHFDDNIHILWTGENTVAPVEQKTIDRFKNRDTDGEVRRDPLFWLNWPVNDVDMTRVFLGKGDMLETGIENLAGVVTNPMQEAEASKVSIFAIADYAWNTEDFDDQKSWEDSMKYVEPNATEAFHTLAKHMAHADPDDGMEADESEDIKDLLDETISRLDDGEPLGDDASELIDELQAIADAGETFLKDAENEGLKKELEPFVNALRDMVLADIEYLKTQQAIEEEEFDSAKEYYVSAQVLREQSLHYDRPMLEEANDEKAIPAAKRLQPFTNNLERNVTQNAEEVLDDVITDFSNNLAYQQKATASTEYNESQGASFLVDGDNSTRWASDYKDMTDFERNDQWVEVELDQAVDMDRIVINWEAARASAYKILASDNGVDYEEIYAYDDDTRGTLVDVINLEDVNAKFIKIDMSQRITDYGYSIYELEIYSFSEVKKLVKEADDLLNRIPEESSGEEERAELISAKDELEDYFESEDTNGMPYTLIKTLTDKLNRFKETIIPSASLISDSVEQFKKDGEIETDRVARALTIHLTAVSQYEKREASEKVVKHMEGFKQLLDQQREEELISEDAYDVLNDEADNLIQQWQ
ncbi:beta-N-acetylglucosaminidase domain-containing protein [Virgibacillus sp. NKC19-3]|uniref:beta-N-acetylglucosaminidase domain-containing protein n=1 Tax=Virgibacillus saliphilus TaxID=2831674 RepID=UPI001C9AF32A|nr:beta-N-acetylglucosaminidase domain-containing protein [Virgibacillus sp. NKC19-3]MBY7144401.1 beta-N-acetylglucosaminidase domain-containing protein [Virgibacillus sp. NKC19-3]